MRSAYGTRHLNGSTLSATKYHAGASGAKGRALSTAFLQHFSEVRSARDVESASLRPFQRFYISISTEDTLGIQE
jgi:hypothetical protein